MLLNTRLESIFRNTDLTPKELNLNTFVGVYGLSRDMVEEVAESALLVARPPKQIVNAAETALEGGNAAQAPVEESEDIPMPPGRLERLQFLQSRRAKVGVAVGVIVCVLAAAAGFGVFHL